MLDQLYVVPLLMLLWLHMAAPVPFWYGQRLQRCGQQTQLLISVGVDVREVGSSGTDYIAQTASPSDCDLAL